MGLRYLGQDGQLRLRGSRRTGRLAQSQDNVQGIQEAQEGAFLGEQQGGAG